MSDQGSEWIWSSDYPEDNTLEFEIGDKIRLNNKYASSPLVKEEDWFYIEQSDIGVIIEKTEPKLYVVEFEMGLSNVCEKFMILVEKAPWHGDKELEHLRIEWLKVL